MDTCENRLWMIRFTVRNYGKGCAVVKASSPAEAETLLVTNGVFNGERARYEVCDIEEILPSPESMLLAERIVEENHETIHP